MLEGRLRTGFEGGPLLRVAADRCLADGTLRDRLQRGTGAARGRSDDGNAEITLRALAKRLLDHVLDRLKRGALTAGPSGLRRSRQRFRIYGAGILRRRGEVDTVGERRSDLDSAGR